MDPLQELMAMPSWTLQRMSPTTLPQDILLRHPVEPESGEVTDAADVARLIKEGKLFRARIAKEKFRYATTPEKAAKIALYAHHRAVQERQQNIAGRSTEGTPTQPGA